MKMTRKDKIQIVIFLIILVLAVAYGGYIDQQFLEAGLIH